MGNQGYIPTAGSNRLSISSPLTQGSSIDEETNDENVTHNLIRPLAGNDDVWAEKLYPSECQLQEVTDGNKSNTI